MQSEQINKDIGRLLMSNYLECVLQFFSFDTSINMNNEQLSKQKSCDSSSSCITFIDSLKLDF